MTDRTAISGVKNLIAVASDKGAWATFSCPHCNGRIDNFGHGEGERMAKTFDVPFLGEIEIHPQIRIGGDTGKPVAR